MKLTKNQVRFKQELTRIERLAKSLGLDLTLDIPKRITKKRLEQISKIKRKNIHHYANNNSPLLVPTSSVDRTQSFLSKINTKKKRKPKKERTQTKKDKTETKQKQKKKKEQKPKEELTPKKESEPIEESKSTILPSQQNENLPPTYDQLEVGYVSADGNYIYTENGWVNRETGELVQEEYGEFFSPWQISRDKFTDILSRDSHGSEILTRILSDYVKEYGEEYAFNAMANFDNEFWSAIDTISRYREADNIDGRMTSDEASVNIELVKHYLYSIKE